MAKHRRTISSGQDSAAHLHLRDTGHLFDDCALTKRDCWFERGVKKPSTSSCKIYHLPITLCQQSKHSHRIQWQCDLADKENHNSAAWSTIYNNPQGLYFLALTPAMSEMKKPFGEEAKHLQELHQVQLFTENKLYITMTWMNEKLHRYMQTDRQKTAITQRTELEKITSVTSVCGFHQ